MDYLEKLASGYYTLPKNPYPNDSHSKEEKMEMRKAVRAEMRDLHAEFRKDALAYHGLTNHPKVDQIYAFVWDKTGIYQEAHDMLEDISSWLV